MPDTERDHHRGVAAVARLDRPVTPPAAPATSSSSSSCAAASATASDEDEEDGFTFAAAAAAVGVPRLQDTDNADSAFPDARIGPVYPVFGRPRWSLPKEQQQQQDDDEEEEDPAGGGTAVVRRFLEEQGCDCAPSASGQQRQQHADGTAELDGVQAKTYCLWSPGRRRMSGSTGSSVLHRLLRRRRVVVEPIHSDDGGKDMFEFLGTSSDRVGSGEEHGCWMNRGTAARSSSTSFLPCKQDLVELVVSAVTRRRSCYLV